VKKFFEFLKVDEQRLSMRLFLILMVVAYLFAVAVRYIWIDWASGFDQFFWNGELMINTNDGYYWAEGARDILAGNHQPNDLSPVDTPLAKLTAFLYKILPVSFEKLILWMPGVFGALLVVPIMLIARVFKQDIVGFGAALLGGIVWSYYNRTMMGYYDTDLLIVVLPTLAVWGVIYALNGEDTKKFIYAPIFAILAMNWHGGAVHIVNGVFIMTLLYTLVFERKNLHFYKFLAVFILALTSLPFLYKIVLVVGIVSAFTVLKDKLSDKVIIIIVAVSTLIYLIFGGASWISGILHNGYVTRALVAADLNISELKYFAVVNTVREAGHIPFEIFANRISGHTLTFWLSVVGYLLFVIRYRLLILSLPMVILGFFALQGGLRFTVFAVPFMALGISYLIFLINGHILKIFSKYNVLAKYIFPVVAFVAVLYPNITHIKGYKVPTVFTKEEVKILNKLGSIASREDYVLTWWDYGYPIRYYSDVKTLVDGGKHSGSVNFPVSFALTRPQLASANMARLDTEYTEMAFKGDRNGSYVKMMMEDYGIANPNKFLNSLNDPAFKLPKKSREIFYYLPLRMLDIFPTVAVFSEIDLRSGNVVKKPLFYQAKRFKDTPTDLILGNNIVLNKKSGVMKLGSQQVPLNSFIVVSLNKDGKTNIREQKINPFSKIYLIYLQSYNRFLLVDSEMLNSTYIQLFVLGKYDPNLFEPVIISPIAKVYRLKR